jgi:Na+/H+ antiporter NhaD/arsenite permease-like protein
MANSASLLLPGSNLTNLVVLRHEHSAHVPDHPRALLVGLNLGPNLAVTGSLSAVLWFRVARLEGAHPSALRYTLLGAVVVPVTIVVAMLALALFAPRGF